MNTKPIHLTHEELTQRNRYDEHTGHLYNRFGRHLTNCSHGRLVVDIERKKYHQSRIIWYLMTGTDAPTDMIVEHKDRNPLNNTWDNLRLATTQQNSWNISKKKGYHWNEAKQLWYVKIGNKFHSTHKTEEEARAARLQAEQEHYGEWAPER